MRPDLRQQLEINRIDSLGILSVQMVNCRAIGGGVGGCLARGNRGEEKNDGSNEDSRVQDSSSFYSQRAVASGKCEMKEKQCALESGWKAVRWPGCSPY